MLMFLSWDWLAGPDTCSESHPVKTCADIITNQQETLKQDLTSMISNSECVVVRLQVAKDFNGWTQCDNVSATGFLQLSPKEALWLKCCVQR